MAKHLLSTCKIELAQPWNVEQLRNIAASFPCPQCEQPLKLVNAQPEASAEIQPLRCDGCGATEMLMQSSSDGVLRLYQKSADPIASEDWFDDPSFEGFDLPLANDDETIPELGCVNAASFSPAMFPVNDAVKSAAPITSQNDSVDGRTKGVVPQNILTVTCVLGGILFWIFAGWATMNLFKRPQSASEAVAAIDPAESLEHSTPGIQALSETMLGEFLVTIDAQIQDGQTYEHRLMTRKPQLVVTKLAEEGKYEVTWFGKRQVLELEDAATFELQSPIADSERLLAGCEHLLRNEAMLILRLNTTENHWQVLLSGQNEPRSEHVEKDLLDTTRTELTKALPAGTRVVQVARMVGRSRGVHRVEHPPLVRAQTVVIRPLRTNDGYLSETQFVEYHYPEIAGFASVNFSLIPKDQIDKNESSDGELASSFPQNIEVARAVAIQLKGIDKIHQIVDIGNERVAIRGSESVHIWDIARQEVVATYDSKKNSQGLQGRKPMLLQTLPEYHQLAILHEPGRSASHSVDYLDTQTLSWRRVEYAQVDRRHSIAFVLATSSGLSLAATDARGSIRWVRIHQTDIDAQNGEFGTDIAKQYAVSDIRTLSSDRRYAVVQTSDSTEMLIDLSTGISHATWQVSQHREQSLGCAKDADCMVVAGYTAGQSEIHVRLISLSNPSSPSTFVVEHSMKDFHNLEISASGRYLVVVGITETHVYDLENRQWIRDPPKGPRLPLSLPNSSLAGPSTVDEVAIMASPSRLSFLSRDRNAFVQHVVLPSPVVGTSCLTSEGHLFVTLGNSTFGWAASLAALVRTERSDNLSVRGTPPSKQHNSIHENESSESESEPIMAPPMHALSWLDQPPIGSGIAHTLHVAVSRPVGLATLQDGSAVSFSTEHLGVVAELKRLKVSSLRFDGQAVSANGNIIALAWHERSDTEASLAVYQSSTGRQLQAWNHLKGSVSKLRLSDDGRLLACCLADEKHSTSHKLLYADIPSGDIFQHEKVYSCNFAAVEFDFQREIAYTVDDAGLDRIHLRTGETVDKTWFGGERVDSIALSPNGERLVVLKDLKKGGVILDSSNGSQVCELQESFRGGQLTGFSPDSKKLLVCDFDRLRILDVETGRTLSSVSLERSSLNSFGHEIRFWPHSSSMVISGSLLAEPTLKDRIVAANRDRAVKQLEDGPPGLLVTHSSLRDIHALTRDNKLVAVSTNKVRFHDLVTAEVLHTLNIDAFYGNIIDDVQLSPDGELIMVGGRSKGPGFLTIEDRSKFGRAARSSTKGPQVVVYEIKTGKLLFSADVNNPKAIGFSPDGSRFAILSRENAKTNSAVDHVLLYDRDTATLNGSFDVPVKSQNGQLTNTFIALSYGNFFQSFRLSDGQAERSANGVRQLYVRASSLAPNGRYLAFKMNSELTVSSGTNGKERTIPMKLDVTDLKVTGRDVCVMATSDNQILVWPVDASKPSLQTKIPGRPTRLVVSDDGALLAVDLEGIGCTVYKIGDPSPRNVRTSPILNGN
ncbi:MAG: WD40 repeat domain-containing protein [Pirellulaceae bacterium]